MNNDCEAALEASLEARQEAAQESIQKAAQEVIKDNALEAEHEEMIDEMKEVAKEEKKIAKQKLQDLVNQSQALVNRIEFAICKPDLSIPGWSILRAPLLGIDDIELRFAESTRENMPYYMPSESARTIIIMVRSGVLRVTYEGLPPVDYRPGGVAILPCGIGRTTVTATHPCTVIAIALENITSLS